MFIDSIKLKNFRCYVDQEFIFTERSGKIMDIIKGDTGAGKTSLFNSIGWCLFGKETSSLLGEGSQDLGIANANAIHGNEIYEVSVELTIGGIGEYSDGIMILRRAKKYKGSTQITPEPNGNLYLSITESGDPEILKGDNAERRLTDFFSREFIEFYMFDGEYLAKGENIQGGNLDTAFRRLFRIGALSTLTRALKDVSDEFSAKRANYPKLEELQREYTENTAEMEGKNKEISELEKEVHEHKDRIRQKEEDLANLKSTYESITKAKEIIDKLRKLKTEDRSLRDAVANARKNYHQAILDHACKASLKELIGDAAKAVSMAREKADIPPYIKTPFLDQLIKNHECICGRSLDDGTRELKMVLKLRDSGDDSYNDNVLSELGTALSKLSADTGPEVAIEGAYKRLRDKMKEEHNKASEIDEYDEDRNELTQQEQKAYDGYNDTFKELDMLKTALKTKKGELDNSIKRRDHLNEILDGLDKRMGRISENNKAAERANKEKRIADNARDTVKLLSSRLSSAFVELLEKELNDIIPQIGFLSGFTANIEVGELNKLSVKVIDQHLDRDRAYLPGGKNQTINILLIAAFTRALSEASFGGKVPFIVMDHPFSNLAMTRKIEIIEKFSSLFKNTKILMLIPPGDFEEHEVASIIGSTWQVSNCQQKRECKAEKEVV